MNEHSIHRPLIVLTALAAIGLVAVFQSGSPNTGAGVPVAAVEPAPSVDHYERLARQHDGIRARQVTPASETQASAAADDKRRELEDSAAQREHAPQALGLEGARPDSEVELDTAQSDTELEIPGHEKARQDGDLRRRAPTGGQCAEVAGSLPATFGRNLARPARLERATPSSAS